MLIEPAVSSDLKQILDRDVYRCFCQLADAETFSGTKAHLWCADTGDVVSAWQRIRWIVEEYGLGAKAATSRYFAVADRHKGVTLYLPERARVDETVEDLVRWMDGWPIDGPIAGDTPRGNGVHTRFEFAYDPGVDVDEDTYHRLYVPAPTPVPAGGA
jgi:hypothetical protein